MRGTVGLGLLATVGLWPACAAAEEGGGEARLAAMVMTPLTGVQRGDPRYYIPPETYTRLVVCSDFLSGDDCSKARGGDASALSSDLQYCSDKSVTNRLDAKCNPEVFIYKTRDVFSRFFEGKKYQQATTLKVSAGQFVASVVLSTFTHTSNREVGEVFVRGNYYKAMNYPLFLVGRGQAAEVAAAEVRTAASREVQSRAVAQTVNAVVAATKLLASPPPLLTQLSSESSRAVADSIDRTISQFSAASIQEDSNIDERISLWRNMTVTLRMPRHEGKWFRKKEAKPGESVNLNDLDYVVIGRWHIFFDAPRVSAFTSQTVECAYKEGTRFIDSEQNDALSASSLTRICENKLNAARKAAFASASLMPNTVLEFPVLTNYSNPVTISKFLRQHEQWATLLAALKTAAKDTSANAATIQDGAAGDFCRFVRDQMSGQGFNTLDGLIVTNALSQSSLLGEAERRLLLANAATKGGSCGRGFDQPFVTPAPVAPAKVTPAKVAPKPVTAEPFSAPTAATVSGQ
ncbi:hypothetical protein GTZ99_12600 [Novosphingobium sp. FSY-8]|uniref:Uncharacterized protein n=1 Tax=Novosphingobium ovatum TaxID=1908523 RepID=A0ABW9XFU5_9SPHN|nr:hypothetical protein [Novosphingobium ovatum]NBC37391.1 hypothetical protein [Novosphingobium ovatum]